MPDYRKMLEDFYAEWENGSALADSKDVIKAHLKALNNFQDKMQATLNVNKIDISILDPPGRLPKDFSDPQKSYIDTRLLEMKSPDMGRRLATRLITQQLHPKNWGNLKTEDKVHVVGILEEAAARQQTQQAAKKTDPPLPRPARTIRIQKNAVPPTPDGRPDATVPPTPDGKPDATVPPTPDGKPDATVPPTPDGKPDATVPPTPDAAPDPKLCRLSDTEILLDENKLQDPAAGLDILDSMFFEQLQPEKWNKATPEARLATLQLAEYGMAAKQGRASRLIVTESLKPNQYGYYSNAYPYKLTISRGMVEKDATVTFDKPGQRLTYNDFPNYKILDTVFHEGRHATQHDAVQGLIDSGVLAIKNAKKDSWERNFAGYLSTGNYTFSSYRFQPVEKDANDFAYHMLRRHHARNQGIAAYKRFLKLKEIRILHDEKTAAGLYGKKYLKKIGKIVNEQYEAKIRRDNTREELRPAADLDNRIKTLTDKTKASGFPPNKPSDWRNKEPSDTYQAALDFLGQSLLTDHERNDKNTTLEAQVHSKLNQLYFGNKSFKEMRVKQPGEYNTIYAAALLAEAMKNQPLISPAGSLPEPASLKTGNDFVAIKQPVSTESGNYNNKAERYATANRFRQSAPTIDDPMSANKGSYGYPATEAMSDMEYGLAVGLLLNKGYKMSDILNPDKLKTAKSILGNSIRTCFPGHLISPPLTKDQAEMLSNANTGYGKFNIHNEISHLDSQANSTDQKAQFYANERFKPEMLQIISGFDQAAQKFKPYSKLSTPDLSANIDNITSILSHDRVKNILSYYQSPEYLQNGLAIKTPKAHEAAKADIIIRQFISQWGHLSVTDQKKDIRSFLSDPSVKDQLNKLGPAPAPAVTADALPPKDTAAPKPDPRHPSGPPKPPDTSKITDPSKTSGSTKTADPFKLPPLPGARNPSGTPGTKSTGINIPGSHVQKITLSKLTQKVNPPKHPGKPITRPSQAPKIPSRLPPLSKH